MKYTLIAVVSLLLAGCFPSLAGNTHVEVLSRLLSPDRSAEAVVVLFSGGATVSSAYVVYLGPTGFDPAKAKDRNAYRMGSYESATTDGERGPKVRWIANDQLSVWCTEYRRFYKNESKVSFGGLTYSVNWTKD